MIIRDIFITNILDDDIQREFIRDTVERERALIIAAKWRWNIKTNNEYHPTTTTQMAMQSMPYNPSTDFAAQMLVEINQAEFHSIEQRLASVEVLAKLGLQRIVRFALLWEEM